MTEEVALKVNYDLEFFELCENIQNLNFVRTSGFWIFSRSWVLAFMILKVALKVNYDFELEICGLCSYFCYLRLVSRRLRNHPDFGCSHEVGFLAFLILKVALKTNYDFKLEICGLCWYFCDQIL